MTPAPESARRSIIFRLLMWLLLLPVHLGVFAVKLVLFFIVNFALGMFFGLIGIESPGANWPFESDSNAG